MGGKSQSSAGTSELQSAQHNLAAAELSLKTNLDAVRGAKRRVKDARKRLAVAQQAGEKSSPSPASEP
jgi:hypothetical protein